MISLLRVIPIHVVGGRSLSRVGPHLMNPGIKLRPASHQHFDAHGGGNIGHLGKHDSVMDRKPSDSGHNLSSVYQCKALGGFKHQRLQTGFF